VLHSFLTYTLTPLLFGTRMANRWFSPFPLAGEGRDGGKRLAYLPSQGSPLPFPSPIEGEGILPSTYDTIGAEQY